MNKVNFVKGFHNEEELKKMKYSELGKTGMILSKMSLGGSPFGGLYESLNEEEGINTIVNALKRGVNYIDTSPFYGEGKSEALIGKALKGVPRNAYYIGTKVGRYTFDFHKMFDFSADRVFQSMDESLRLLGLDYVDILQVHDVEYAPSIDIILNETLPAVQKIVKQGKARFIGITGYSLSVLKEIIEKSTVKIDSVLSYARNTLIDDELRNYIPFFQEKNIGVIDAAVLSMGMLSNSGPQPWHPAPQDLKKRAHDATQFCQEKESDIARLAVQHSLTEKDVTTFVIGIASQEILEKNLSVFTCEPTEREIEINQIIKERFFSGIVNKNWEGVDVKNYWEKMKSNQPGTWLK